jgi:hypothetical protein
MISRVTGVAWLALLMWALWWTVRLERADWLFVKGDEASIRQAMRWAPGNAEYASALAEAEPGRSAEILNEAEARNPLDGGLRLELGLAKEQRGDFAGAERDMREAALLDRGFGPRAVIADFYFRRRDAEKFWPAVKAALAVSYGDVWAQFRECWALSSDAGTILERAIPDRPIAMRLYLDFLLSEGRLDAAVPVAARVLASGDKGAAPSLENYCDRMLEKWRGADALAVWQALVERKWIAESGRGFDWRVPARQGIHVEHVGRGWRINFSGQQAESSEILSQYEPLVPNRRYVLTTSGIGSESGLRCGVLLADGRDLLGGGSMAFQTPENVSLGRLVLAYRRVPGTTRFEGSIHMQELALKAEER